MADQLVVAELVQQPLCAHLGACVYAIAATAAAASATAATYAIGQGRRLDVSPDAVAAVAASRRHRRSRCNKGFPPAGASRQRPTARASRWTLLGRPAAVLVAGVGAYAAAIPP